MSRSVARGNAWILRFLVLLVMVGSMAGLSQDAARAEYHPWGAEVRESFHDALPNGGWQIVSSHFVAHNTCSAHDRHLYMWTRMRTVGAYTEVDWVRVGAGEQYDQSSGTYYQGFMGKLWVWSSGSSTTEYTNVYQNQLSDTETVEIDRTLAGGNVWVQIETSENVFGGCIDYYTQYSY